MTNRLRRLFGPTCLLVALAACGGNDDNGDAPPPEPLVIESPRSTVVAGTDTTLVFGPTVFTYIALSPTGAEPSAAALAAVQDFQAAVRNAQTVLGALGVRIEAVTEPPRVLGAVANADAGPPLAGAPYGYLFVDAVGNVRRVTSPRSAAQLVCLAAETFGLTLDASRSASCR